MKKILLKDAVNDKLDKYTTEHLFQLDPLRMFDCGWLNYASDKQQM